MSDNLLKLTLKDWLFNAGVSGLINILEHSGDDIEFDGQDVYINISSFENFEDKYFRYFIDCYGGVTIYARVMEKLSYLSKLDFDKDVGNIKKIYEDVVKYLIAKLKNSAYASLPVDIDFNLLKLTKENFNDSTKYSKDLYNLLELHKNEILKSEVTGFYDQKAKASKSPNAIIDKYINTNMLNISKDTKELKDYLAAEKSGKNYFCFNCNNRINFESNDKGLSFLNRMFFDTSRKTSHVWNFISDIQMCPVCRFIYFCVPAGFSTVVGKGIFINMNQDTRLLKNINNNIKTHVLKDQELNNNTTYKALLNAIEETMVDTSKYELSDIQVVRYENQNGNEKYRFNILSRNQLDVINKSKDELSNLIKTGYKEVNSYFKLYEDVIKTILDNQNLFLLIHKLLSVKLTRPDDAHYHTGHIKDIIRINFHYLKGVGKMESKERDMLKSYSGAGYYLKQAYKDKNSENKLNGISYKLLNALKTNNKGMFMDTILNCYLYTGKEVPGFFTECLKDNELLKTIGYAFVSGLIEGENKNNNEGEK